MQLIFTLHAKERMAARGISKQQVLDALQKGAKARQTDGLLAVYGYVRVAFKVRGDRCIIKTVELR